MAWSPKPPPQQQREQGQQPQLPLCGLPSPLHVVAEVMDEPPACTATISAVAKAAGELMAMTATVSFATADEPPPQNAPRPLAMQQNTVGGLARSLNGSLLLFLIP